MGGFINSGFIIAGSPSAFASKVLSSLLVGANKQIFLKIGQIENLWRYLIN